MSGNEFDLERAYQLYAKKRDEERKNDRITNKTYDDISVFNAKLPQLMPAGFPAWVSLEVEPVLTLDKFVEFTEEYLYVIKNFRDFHVRDGFVKNIDVESIEKRIKGEPCVSLISSTGSYKDFFDKYKKKILQEMVTKRDITVISSSNEFEKYVFYITCTNVNLVSRIINMFSNIIERNIYEMLNTLFVENGFTNIIRAMNNHLRGRAYNLDRLFANAYSFPFDFAFKKDGKPHFISLTMFPIMGKTDDAKILRNKLSFDMVNRLECPLEIILCYEDTLKNRKTAEQIKEHYASYNITNIEVKLWDDFVRECFGEEVLIEFNKMIAGYKEDIHNLIGYQITEIFNDYNLKQLKIDLEKELKAFRYDLINTDNLWEMYGGFISDENEDNIDSTVFSRMYNLFINKKRYKILFGNRSFAKSYLTSEWLFKKYVMLPEMDNTFIVSGYLKSVEQLLWDILKIKGINRLIRTSNNSDASIDGSDDIDVTLGNIQYFLSDYDNRDLFDKSFKKNQRAVSCYFRNQLGRWRNYYRNGYFHKDNLQDIKLVEIIRNQTIYLYFLILGSLSLNVSDIEALEI